MSRYWSYDGDTWDTHETAEEARDHCQKALDSYRDYAPDGWAEEVEYIMWGPIAERVVQTNLREHLPTCKRGGSTMAEGCDDDCEVQGGLDYSCDYELLPLEAALVEITHDPHELVLVQGPTE